MTNLLEKPKASVIIPASIAKAIATVMASMTKAVPKSGYNKHGAYKFSTTDDVYASLSLRMAEAGLVVLCLEDGEPEIKVVERDSKEGGEKIRQQWLKIRYRFILATPQDTWEHPGSARSLFLQITGPQSFMASQSYAEKAFLRSLFKLATGDVDLDGLPGEDDVNQDQGPANRPRKRSKAETVSAPAPAGPRRDLPPLVSQRVSGHDPNSEAA